LVFGGARRELLALYPKRRRVVLCSIFRKQFRYNGNMGANADMTYRFVWDSEPTDEQLLVIMQEVGEEARQKSEQIAKQVIENIKQESIRIRSALQMQQK